MIATTNLSAPGSMFCNAAGDINNQFHVHNTFVTPTESSSGLQSVPAFTDVPELLSVHFTGREKQLAQIAEAFNRPRSAVPLRCALYGNQGVGKSQLAFMWANSTFTSGENTYVFWMSATTVEKLNQGYSKILVLTNHVDRLHQEQTVRLTAARRWLEEVDSGNWLLILDNVFPETIDFLREHLPRKNNRGSILFTTRTGDIAAALASAAGEQHEAVEVPKLDVKAAVELFLSESGDGAICASSASLEQMVASVGCLPLAISHTAAYMRRSRRTIEDMIALQKSDDKINVFKWENTLTNYEYKSVAATFHCQLQDLEQTYPHASSLLKVLAYFDPESIHLDTLIANVKAVPLLSPTPPTTAPPKPRSKTKNFGRILRKLRGGTSPVDIIDQADGEAMTTQVAPLNSLLAIMQSQVELQNAITQLQDRCLIAYHDSSRSSTLRIHDLIQSVVLANTKESGMHKQYFELAVELVFKAFAKIKNRGSPESWALCEALVPHIQSLTTRQEISEKAKARLLKANRHVAGYLHHRGRFEEAEKLYINLLADSKRLFGLEDRRTLPIMHNLASVYESQGRHSDAEVLMKQVLQIKEMQLEPDHPDLHSTKIMLGSIYCSQSRFDEAEKLFKNVLQAREKQLGMENPLTLRARHALATTYSSQGRSTDAETLYEQVLQSSEEQLGLKHRDTLRAMHAFARFYDSQDRHSEAEALYNRALPITEELLGLDHPDTLLMKHDLALLCKKLGRGEKAEVVGSHSAEKTS